MASVNNVTLLGNVGRDPEVRYMPSGDAVAVFSLATTEVWKDKSGKKQERTDWHRVECFGKTAEVVKDYVSKGRQLYIEGSIRYDEWVDKAGEKKYSTKIKAHRVLMLGGRDNSARKADVQEGATGAEIPKTTGVGGDDELPF